ncbi:(2Fe-2S) ferredoxin domain-containing protein [Thiospirochaeta perfilievii]|uniref:(2Fe-2S) ferredoxin domain-containing protein n=1 Tax=Thiospirochaeta perfilievii TaxID=252967 RepID=A0A5C1Q8I0_9SPIO|nr:(2Fe-2S) ferredoxin domain-containing protein [Thiospirochaeta perfilievii]QEN03196.1 (2Fe-2S) ferredoxin domain-containing protein [Thiospirochaeta perfilievii]
MVNSEIKLCMGSSCFSRGNSDNLQKIQNFIEENSVKWDIKLVGSLCSGECKTGPNITVNGVLYQNVTNDVVDELLNKLIKDEDHV